MTITILVPPISNGYAQTYLYSSDIYRAHQGRESRFANLSTGADGRRSIRCEWAAKDRDEWEWLTAQLFTAAREDAYLPLFFSAEDMTGAVSGAVASLDTTRGEWRAGMRVAMWDPVDVRTYELATIQSLNSNSVTMTGAIAGSWTTGHRIAPLLLGTFSDDAAGVIGFNAYPGRAEGEFVEVNPSVSGALTPTSSSYGSSTRPVFNQLTRHLRVPLNWRSGRFQFGPDRSVPVTIRNEATLELTTDVEILLSTREEINDFITVFKYNLGATLSFWTRSRHISARLSRAASSGAGTVYVYDNGLDDIVNNVLNRHIWLPDEGTSGGVGHLITGATASAGEIALTISPNLTANVAIGDRVEDFLLVRFRDDEVTVESVDETGEHAIVNFGLVELQPETADES